MNAIDYTIYEGDSCTFLASHKEVVVPLSLCPLFVTWVAVVVAAVAVITSCL